VLEHGITDEEVAEGREAPPWSQVLPELFAVTAERSILAYNASFDEGVVARRIHRDGLDLGHLAEDGRSRLGPASPLAAAQRGTPCPRRLPDRL
jgi:DNA polymerase III epsilon subunit-like protein